MATVSFDGGMQRRCAGIWVHLSLHRAAQQSQHPQQCLAPRLCSMLLTMIGHVTPAALCASINFAQGDRNIKDSSGMYSSAVQGCHEEGFGGSTILGDFLKLRDRTELIQWPEI
eukprot:366172-Chlamydomonas_euryale.AAC.2